MSIQDYALSYQKSPIYLVNGIAPPGAILPIISITQAADFNDGVTGNSGPLNLEDFIYDFNVLPGGSLMENQVATYPFANQSVAANAVIFQPLHLSLEMLAPVRTSGGYQQKLASFQSLQSSLNQHVQLGGMFTVATPAFLYTNMLLLSFKDITHSGPERPQDRWQWDFYQPLLTLQAAEAAQNSLNQKITNQTKITPNTEGYLSSTGLLVNANNPQSLINGQVVPAGSTAVGATVSGPATQQPMS